MTALDFAKALSKIELVEDDYLKAGFSKKEIQEQKQVYELIPKNKEYSEKSNPIESLIEGYDVSRLEIGMITFNSKPIEKNGYVLFGKHEIDDLAIDQITGEIVLLEENMTHLMQYCAKDGSSFFDALIEMAKFLEKRAFDESLYEDEAINLAVAENCAELAGGDKYLDFYTTMTGF